jgi:eukaryotic-like serine/threonine-protein kinase
VTGGGDGDRKDSEDLHSLGMQHTMLPDAATAKTQPPPAIVNPAGHTARDPDRTVTSIRPLGPERPPREHTLVSSEPAPARPVELGTVLAGKYQLERLLGSGGMGKVYKGQHLSLGVPVAVKVMHAHVAMQDEFVRRFRHEAHAASVVSHPNVVRVLDFGEEQGLLYLVMEYLQGHSLSGWIDRMPGPPPLAEVRHVLTSLLDALDVAHRFGIVHRDLKPDNVFLADAGGARVVKVLDFGLAHVDDVRDAGPTLTSKDAIAGTPDYMSPEQCRSLAVGPSADLYSVGCLLTTLLQLRPPFEGSSAIDTMARHMFTRPPPLDRPPGAEPVPPLLEKLRLDLLAKLPERRPRDAAAAKARLLEALSPEASAVRLPTRKGDEPLGGRAERAPSWAAGDRAPPTPRNERRAVALHRLHAADATGIPPETEAALGAQQIDLTVVPAPEAAAAFPVLVLDVGPHTAEARALLETLRKTAPAMRIIVCAARLGTEQINELVAAGAADVARYPVAPDALVRKIERVLRRGR